jgi:TPR repeat protein
MQKRTLQATVLLSLFAVGCASPSSSDRRQPTQKSIDAPPVPAEVRQAEDAFDTYLSTHGLPSDLAVVSFDMMVTPHEEKTMAMDRIIRRYRGLLDDESKTEFWSMAAFRVGQLYLNMGCEIQSIEPPSSADKPGLTQRWQSSLNQQASVVLQKARSSFKQAKKYGDLGKSFDKSEPAAVILAAYKSINEDKRGEHIASLCQSTRDHWFRAPESLLVKCNGGSAKFCFALAVSEATNDEQSLSRYEQACELGYTKGCKLAAKTYIAEGDQPGRAIELFDTACQQGDKDSCMSTDFVVDPQQGARYETACVDGAPLACLKLVDLHAKAQSDRTMTTRICLGDQPPVFKDAAAETKACREGSAPACAARAARLIGQKPLSFPQGKLVFKSRYRAMGLKTTGNLSRAETLEKYRNACEEGKAPKCLLAASLADETPKRRALLRRGCDGGSMRGCDRLADDLLESGDDVQEAVTLLDRACHGGREDACETAARLFHAGQKVTQSPSCAASYVWSTCRDYPFDCQSLNDVLAPGER